MEDTQFSKKDYVILGAGGLARELESWTTQTQEFHSKHNLLGFLDDNENALNKYKNDFSIIGSLRDQDLKKNKAALIGIASCEYKNELYSRLKSMNIEILSFKHFSSIIGNNNEIGEGFILFPNAIVTCNVTIGKAVFINLGSQIGHDAKIGDFTSIMANVDIGGGAEIGKNVFIGSNAVILPGVKIPDNSRIGAGAVVIRSIKKEGTYFGNPAKCIF